MFRRRLSVRTLLLMALCGLVVHGALAQQDRANVVSAAGEQLMALANQSRARAGVGRLQWDEKLAEAARQHCLRMAAEGPIAHRYGGEADMATRANEAGAHFDVIEENVAVGPSPSEIHEEWMQSPGHRANLLSNDVNRVGIAVVAARGVLYAVADYSHGVESLDRGQVETRVASLIKNSGMAVLEDHEQARAACATDRGVPAGNGGMQPGFVMRWQDSDLTELPRALTQKLVSRQYSRAEVGSCPAQNLEGDFTAYRVAVVLY